MEKIAHLLASEFRDSLALRKNAGINSGALTPLSKAASAFNSIPFSFGERKRMLQYLRNQVGGKLHRGSVLSGMFRVTPQLNAIKENPKIFGNPIIDDLLNHMRKRMPELLRFTPGAAIGKRIYMTRASDAEKLYHGEHAKQFLKSPAGVLAHEMGHLMDKKYMAQSWLGGITEGWARRIDPLRTLRAEQEANLNAVRMMRHIKVRPEIIQQWIKEIPSTGYQSYLNNPAHWKNDFNVAPFQKLPSAIRTPISSALTRLPISDDWKTFITGSHNPALTTLKGHQSQLSNEADLPTP